MTLFLSILGLAWRTESITAEFWFAGHDIGLVLYRPLDSGFAC